jgi:hypothetical protein
MYADLIAREQPLAVARQSMVDEARERICNSILGSDAHHLTGPDDHMTNDGNGSNLKGPSHPQGELNTKATVCEKEAEILLVGMEERSLANEDRKVSRRSSRSNRFAGQMGEGEVTPWDFNADNLAIRQSTGMGWCLFTKEAIQSNATIAVYTGKSISKKVAHSSRYKSQYVVEVGKACIDAWDTEEQLCMAYGGYANDAVNSEGRRDLWNAEFVIDENDPKEKTILLRATRDLVPGEQIYVWYGPTYWCDDSHPVELLVMTVITYGINI